MEFKILNCNHGQSLNLSEFQISHLKDDGVGFMITGIPVPSS